MNRKKRLAGEEEQLPLYRNTERVLLRVVFIYVYNVDKTEDLIIAYLILFRNIINNHTDRQMCYSATFVCFLLLI